MAYKKPLLTLLNDRKPNYSSYKDTADEYYSRLTECFDSMKVKVSQDGYKISPVNTVFSFSLDPETSYKSVKAIEPELSLSVGFEVKIFHDSDEGRTFSVSIPRGERSYVGLGQIISSKAYNESKSPLSLAVGINELGQEEILDLQEAPHLLISGTTGSGKTVYLDDVILSILYKASPNMVKLVLADPSKKDFAAYEGIPHLLFPVASDKPTIYEQIKYVRNRMDERYKRLAKLGKRNVQSFGGRGSSYFTRIVVIVDKYLELTYEMPADFEECVSEIARKGRAAGIHLIINAQSARSEVISSSIKANIPARVAFSVADWQESKAILDKTGAQKLLGNGDMFYIGGLNDNPKHIQAPNVTLDEIKGVVANVIERNGRASYINDYSNVSEPLTEDTEFIRTVLDGLMETRSVDVYSLQRDFNIEYSDASKLISFLEDNDLVSEYNGNKGRTVNQDAVRAMIRELDG